MMAVARIVNLQSAAGVVTLLSMMLGGCWMQSGAGSGAASSESFAVEARRWAALTGCDLPVWGQPPRTGVFRGIYRVGFEGTDLQPDGSKCRWSVNGNVEDLVFTLQLLRGGPPDPYNPPFAYVELEGTLSGFGEFGHARELVVQRVLSAQVLKPSGVWEPLAVVPQPTPTVPGPLSPKALRP